MQPGDRVKATKVAGKVETKEVFVVHIGDLFSGTALGWGPKRPRVYATASPAKSYATRWNKKNPNSVVRAKVVRYVPAGDE